MIIGIQERIPLFSPWNLNFQHSLDAEINLEDEEIKIFNDWDV